MRKGIRILIFLVLYIIMVSSMDDLFEIKMYIDKNRYGPGEVIDCYATLEYVGENNSINVYSSSPLLNFTIKDDKLFKGDSIVSSILATTTFMKGELVKYDFTKSGGWTEDDPHPDFYEKFHSEKELILPPGTYELSAVLSCSLDEKDIVGSQYKSTVSASIKVAE